MRIIELTRGKSAIVDDEDYELVMGFSWHFTKSDGCRSGYARRTEKIRGPDFIYKGQLLHSWGFRTVQMHQQIMNFPGCYIDHADGDGLNNQRSNLRLASQSQNRANVPKLKRVRGSSSDFKGVCFVKGSRRKPWRASIRFGRRLICLGYFREESEAATAYDAAAREYFGEFANTNF